MMKKSNFNFYSLSKVSLLMILILLGAVSCKNKKKMSEVSDPTEAQARVEEGIEMEDLPTPVPPREAVKEPSKTDKLQNYFGAIANSPLASANGSIAEALMMFSDPTAPVLVIIYNEDGTTDYDEPTTIQKYLEYLKDTKNNSAMVEEMVMDGNGKIKELVLKK